MMLLAAGCSGGAPSHGPVGGEGGEAGAGGEGTGGAAVTGGKGGADATGGKGGNRGATPDAATTPDADLTPDASTPPDERTTETPDAAPTRDAITPMGSDGGPQPSYEGQVPIYYGPEVGPIVQMQCPGDPTEGWTEYQDSFHVEHPYDLPTNTRFSIIGGVYNFWVFPNDKPHSVNAQGRNPRTEAAYGGTFDKGALPGVSGTKGQFTTGKRLYSADMRIEPSALGDAFMQIHTTTTGGGPIGVRMNSNSDVVNNGKLTVVKGSTVPGGLVDKWFNWKASLDTATLEVKIYVNNCLKSTYKGDRGDGNFYFKNGVYFCSNGGGCRTHFKNIHLYYRQ
jgi:hypothetical protein